MWRDSSLIKSFMHVLFLLLDPAYLGYMEHVLQLGTRNTTAGACLTELATTAAMPYHDPIWQHAWFVWSPRISLHIRQARNIVTFPRIGATNIGPSPPQCATFTSPPWTGCGDCHHHDTRSPDLVPPVRWKQLHGSKSRSSLFHGMRCS